METDICAYLKQFGKTEVLYTPNPGNAGDSVIASATYQTFDRVGLNYKIVRPSLLHANGKIVIYSGGGNLVKPTSFSSKFVSAHHKSAMKFIVLPHTLKEVDFLLDEFGSNVDIFCRERTSYAYVKERAYKSNVFLDHDMAFNFDISKFLEEYRFLSSPNYLRYTADRYLLRKSIPSWKNIIRSKKLASMQRKIFDVNNSNELYCFRMDGESKGKELPKNNFDLSLIFDYGTETPLISGYSTMAVFSTIKHFSVIHTDRLHMAISGALLGLTVHFYANNYFKCRAVYEYSILGRYPNVIWHEDYEIK